MSPSPSFNSHQGWDSFSVKCGKGSAHILQDAHSPWVFCAITETLFPVHHAGDEWERFIVSRGVQLQRILSEGRDTDNSGPASWPACQ